MKVPEEIIGLYWNDRAIYSGNTLMLRITGNGEMSCCGTATLTEVGKGFYSEKEKQDFAYMLMKYINTNYSYLFIANDSQMKQIGFGNVCGLLRELGAKEVDDSRNRNWGSSRMHLHVWNPTKLCGGAIRKYLHVERNGDRTPLWYHRLDAEGKAKALEESLPYWKVIQDQKTLMQERQKRNQTYQDLSALYRLNLLDNPELEQRLKQLGWVKANEISKQSDVSASAAVGLSKPLTW
jgi:hypothetical protein